jgi:PHD/YefM family antitoxin component YafN of YafNO toxin-antitoxin module
VAEEWEYGMMKETLLGREAETETEMKKQMERRERAEKQKQEKEKEERKKRGVWKVRIGYALL